MTKGFVPQNIKKSLSDEEIDEIRNGIAEFYKTYPFGNFYCMDKKEYKRYSMILEEEIMYLTSWEKSFNPLKIKEFENKTLDDYDVGDEPYPEFNHLFGY